MRLAQLLPLALVLCALVVVARKPVVSKKPTLYHTKRPTTTKFPTVEPTAQPTNELFLVSGQLVVRMSPLNSSLPNVATVTLEIEDMEYEANVHANKTVHKWHVTDLRGKITLATAPSNKMKCKPLPIVYKLSRNELGLFILAANGPGFHPINARVTWKGALFSAFIELMYSNGKIVRSSVYDYNSSKDPSNLPPGWIKCPLKSDKHYFYTPAEEDPEGSGWHIRIYKSLTYAPSTASSSVRRLGLDSVVEHSRPVQINVLDSRELLPAKMADADEGN